MIKREIYMNRIRPFMGKDVIKVMTGIRRAGKSVMLALIQQELSESGIKKYLKEHVLCRERSICFLMKYRK